VGGEQLGAQVEDFILFYQECSKRPFVTKKTREVAKVSLELWQVEDLGSWPVPGSLLVAHQRPLGGREWEAKLECLAVWRRS
jgi:hypothetical protein